ncbi:hypothetical protein [Brucella sp. NBRC 12950]|uniref:hypothetical protein n=1 Tax=Brucella sp. NBRC 12950 TaxID=2994518 RepID=UPI0024A4B5B1|nr:hypothetical protein [Brucella sp. NBRC 12950]GLU28407.1 hypothetical protein Brsp01_36400 [Brucella sp. NBRC 12950]
MLIAIFLNDRFNQKEEALQYMSRYLDFIIAEMSINGWSNLCWYLALSTIISIIFVYIWGGGIIFGIFYFTLSLILELIWITCKYIIDKYD